MGLQSQTVDVPIIAQNQSWPTASGVAGRLLGLNNAIAKRWMESEAGSKLRVEKRDGFVDFGTTVRNTSGSVSTKTLTGISMVASRGNQLIATGKSNIFAAGKSSEWFSDSYVAPTNSLTETPVVNRGTVDQFPDSCSIGTRTMHTWTTLLNAGVVSYIEIVDDDGTVVLAQTPIATPSTYSKVVSDGVRFWVMLRPTAGLTPYVVLAYDTDGALLGFDNALIPQDGLYFDVTANTEVGSNGIVFIKLSGAGPNFSIQKITWNGSNVVVGAPVVSAAKASTGRVGFLKNSAANHKYYAVSIDGAGPYDFYAWEINDVTLASTPVTLAVAQAAAPVEISGWVDTAITKYRIALSFLNAVPTVQLNFTQLWTITGGVAALAETRRSLTVVSRAFLLNSKWYCVGYYQSNPSALPLTNNIQQSTFYLIDLQTWQVCGEWAKGTAYADWQRTTLSGSWFHISTPRLDTESNVHVTLNYRARSFTTSTGEIWLQGRRGVAAFNPTVVFGNNAVNTVGIKDYKFGSELSRAVEFANETLIPGPRVTSWTGVPSNHGISLVSEMIAPVPAAAGAGLSQNATYEVVAVVEWTAHNGDRVRSIAGPPYAFSTSAGQRQVTYSGYMVQNDVGKDNMIISLYRTAFINGIQSQQHYKVTNDLVPLYNVSGGAASWTYVDTLTDVEAAVNEILYVDKGFLDRYPCPSFTAGCADAQRTYVVGYDGAVWFSGSKSEGDATWFSPAFRLLLNNDIPVSCQLLDTTLVILGRSSNIYVVNVNALPANDGSGTTPIPLELPLTHGCTGPTAVCSAGVVFPSTQGGIWLVNRGLNDVFIGKGVKEFVETNGPVIDIAVDRYQRVWCLMRAGNFAVFDSVTNVWSTHTLPETVSCIGINAGLPTVGLSAAVSQQTPGTFADSGAAIISSFKIQYQLGGIKNFKRIWNMQIFGEYRGAHNLTVNGYFADDLTTVVETYLFTPSPTQSYNYELPPAVEECADLTLEFIDSFPGGASAGFALELVSFELGIQQGLDRLIPTTQRKSAT